MKKSLFFKFFLFTVIAAFVTFTSCKDYDDDISNLENKIAGLSTTLNDLKSQIEAGAVITDVASTANGLKVTLSNGKSYDVTNGKDGVDGKDGANGKDGSVITIGENGNWFIDGVDTTKPAQGINGTDGKDGKDGANGFYYVPNADGYWYKHDGDIITKGDLWMLPGVITAVVNEYGDVTFANVQSGDDSHAITFFNNKLLRSLVLIPHHYVNGVEAIGFNPLAYVCGGLYDMENSLIYNNMYGWYGEGVMAGPGASADTSIVKANPNTVLVQYHVNPSSITEDMIDVDNLSFTYKLQEHKTRSKDINAKAEFSSLIDGILTVRIDLDANKAEYDGLLSPVFNLREKMDMIALQVPLSEKAKKGYTNFEAVITSDWARVDVEDLAFPKIDRIGTECDVVPATDSDDVTYTEDYTTAQAAKDMTVEDDSPYILELVYNKKHDLADYLTTTALTPSDCGKFNPADYGLVWNFDLLDENNKVIKYVKTSNDTEQQEFIKVLDNKKGTVEARVYDAAPGAGVTDAIGRTPIVRVQLIDPVTKCVVTYGFIKIQWVKEQPKFDAVYPAEKVDFSCDTKDDHSTMGLNIKTKWMNTHVMNAMGTYYQEFIHNYTLDASGLYDANGKKLTGVNAWGVVVPNPDVEEGEPEVTDLFSVYLNNTCEVADKTSFTGYVHYTDNVTGKVSLTIKVTININMPDLTVAGHNNTYWQGGNNSSNVFEVNAVQYATAPQLNPTANYRTDLLNGFTNGTTYTDDINKIVKSSIKGHTACDVEFVFDSIALKTYSFVIDDITFSIAKKNLRVSSNGKNLEFLNGTTWTVASYIAYTNPMPGLTHAGEAIHLNESGQDANDSGDSWPHKFAQALIGKKVPVKLAAKLCCETECDLSLSRDIRKFEVYFIPPMHINSTFTESFEDWITGGDYIKLDKAFTLTDFAKYLVSEAADDATLVNEKHRWTNSLWNYYEIHDVVWDVANATCNIDVVNGDLDVVPGAKKALPENYLVSYVNTAPNLNSLRFQNNSGAPLAKEFEIYVPVTVGHKWGTLSTTVTIKVLPAQ